MAKATETTDDETLGIEEAIRELWDRAKNPNLTTSQELEAIDPKLAERYRLQHEIRDAVKRIQAGLEQDRQERAATKSAVKRGVMQIIKALWPD